MLRSKKLEQGSWFFAQWNLVPHLPAALEPPALSLPYHPGPLAKTALAVRHLVEEEHHLKWKGKSKLSKLGWWIYSASRVLHPKEQYKRDYQQNWVWNPCQKCWNHSNHPAPGWNPPWRRFPPSSVGGSLHFCCPSSAQLHGGGGEGLPRNWLSILTHYCWWEKSCTIWNATIDRTW